MKPNKVDSNRETEPAHLLESDFNSNPYSQGVSVYWVHYLLFTLWFLIIAVSVINILNPHFLWGHFEIEDYALHSTFEALGAISAILVAFLPLQALFEKIKPSYIFISIGFLVMGLWDLFHSFFTIGNGFVFTHSIALLLGGLFFLFIVFPWKSRVVKYKNRLLLLIGLLTIIFAISAAVNREFFPEMLRNGEFTTTANYINLIAGIIFGISSLKLLGIYFQEKEIGVLILIFVTVSSAVVGITFQYSGAWTDGWWLWHVIRLISFIGLLSYMFWRVHHLNNERNVALQDLKIKHNQLAENEDRFRLVNEATMQGLWDWNVPKNEVYFSPVWKMQVGYNDDELENDFNNWIKLLHPEDKDRCLKAVDDYLKNPKGKFILEFRFQHKNGHYVWIHNQAAAVVNESGNVQRMFGAHTNITTQKEAEEKLIESEKLFRIIFENSPLGKSQTGLDGTLNINKAFSDITGYNIEEIQQKNWKEITHPDDIQESEDIIKALLDGKMSSAQYEKRYMHKNGHYVWTEVNTALHRNEFGEPQFFITTISDISKRKDIEAKIIQSEKKFKGLFENDPGAIIIADPETGILKEVNPAAEKLMEMSRDELIGLHQSKLHPEEVIEEQAEKFKTLQGNPDVVVDTLVLTKTGIRKAVEIRVSMVEIENKPHLLGIFHDITGRVEAKKAVNREIEFTDSVINSMPGIFYLFDQSGKFLKWNNTLAELSGLSFKEVGTKSPLDFIAQDHREKVGEAIQTAFKEGMVLVEADFLVKGQSPVPFLFTGKRIMRDKLPLLVGVGIDITKRKNAESEKEKAMQILNNTLKKLKRSNEELERFAYVASHDLQEPLRMVSSFTQLLEKRYKGQMDDRADRYIHYAVDGANRMQQLINDLLDFSRVSTRGDDFIVFDTNEAINNVKNSLSLRIEESGTIIETGKLPEIKGDKTQIERVFLNLLSNAIKFRNPDKSPVIKINAKSEGSKWLFSIKDNGIGIDEKFQEKVFVIFQRLHGGDQYKGTGIGLAICKRIIQRHGGEIWFKSEEGKGSTFYFTINKFKNK